LLAGDVAQYLFQNGTERCPQQEAVTRCSTAVQSCVREPVRRQ
jgi:hypothetical protein